MKKLLHVAGAAGVILAMSVLGSPVAAREAAAIQGTFKTAIIVSNPGSVPAMVTMSFVNSSGGTALTMQPFSVPARGSVPTFVPNIQGLADGRYSLVIDSDQPVAAIANLAGEGPTTAASYNGIASADTGRTFNIPTVYKSYVGRYTSNIIVQNAGTATANVSISYRSGATQVASQTLQVAPGASVTVDQGEVAGLPAGFRGSAVVTADQDVGAIFLVTAGTGLSAGRGAKGGAPVVYAPVAYNNYAGYVTAISVQNADSVATNVTVDYFDSRTGQAAGSETPQLIQPGDSKLFLQFDTAGRTAVVPANFNGAAVVRSVENRNIIVNVDVSNEANGYLEAYGGFQASSATTTLSCPAIFKNYAPAGHNYGSSLTVQNVGSVPTNLTVQYLRAGSTDVVRTVTVDNLQPNAGYFVFNPGDAALPDGQFAAIVQSSGSPIVGVVNQLDFVVAGDVLQTYSCANSSS